VAGSSRPGPAGGTAPARGAPRASSPGPLALDGETTPGVPLPSPMTNTPNHAKAERYAETLQRCEMAIDATFHLEAIALLESLITDRLLASAERRYGQPRASIDGLGRALDFHVARLEGAKARAAHDGHRTEDLFGALHLWRDRRNALMHGIAKSFPGEEIENYDTIMAEAAETARRGLVLFRMLDSWTRSKTPDPVRPPEAAI
jgi:hypothetical protein